MSVLMQAVTGDRVATCEELPQAAAAQAYTPAHLYSLSTKTSSNQWNSITNILACEGVHGWTSHWEES